MCLKALSDVSRGMVKVVISLAKDHVHTTTGAATEVNDLIRYLYTMGYTDNSMESFLRNLMNSTEFSLSVVRQTYALS